MNLCLILFIHHFHKLNPKVDDVTPNTYFDVNRIPDDFGLQASRSSTSDNDDDGGESEGAELKLTRAQRKRLRKKKLNEDMCRRKQLIGPLKPDSSGGSAGEECTPPVRQNADDSGGQSKLKKRRMAKKLEKERLKPPEIKDSL